MSRLQPPLSCNVYTPSILANAMVRALGDRLNARWLEPCVGKGAFLESLSNQGVNATRITGIDLSAHCEPNDRLARVRRSTEFLRWAAESKSQFDRIVANPPFISLSNVPHAIQAAACRHVCPGGCKVPLGSNCWYAFLCASLRLLKPSGSLAFVLPASFEYANYGATLRQLLPGLFKRWEIHRCLVPLFDEVQEGSIVAIGHEYHSTPEAHWRSEYEDLGKLSRGIQRSKGLANSPRIFESSHSKAVVPLPEVMSIGIGAVTGDADYFLMNEDRRLLLDLPISAMQPVISRSNHVLRATIRRCDWEGMRNNGERVWLFRPDASSLKNCSVKRYLARPLEDGGCRKEAYKIRNRDPWYLAPLPKRPHGFLSGMCQTGPVICFNNTPSLTATNTLYTVRFRSTLSQKERCTWALMLLTTDARRQLNALARGYAAGLTKFEPGDLSSLMLPKPRVTVSWAVYKSAMTALLSDKPDEACHIADKYL